MTAPDQKPRLALEALSSVLAALTKIEDPLDRAKVASLVLDAVPRIQTALRETRQAAVRELREQGLSHAEVGTALGVSRARAQQIAEGKTSGKRVEPKPDA